MPQLPRYDSQRELTTQRPGVLKDPRTESTPGRLIGQAGEVIFDAGIKWQNAQNTMKFTQAKANYEVASAQIMSKAVLDPDYANSEVYIQDLRKVKNESMSVFANAHLQEKYGIALERDLGIDTVKVNHIFRKKFLDHSVTELEKGIDALTKKAQNGSPVEAAKAFTDIQGLIDLNVKDSILSKEQGREAKIDAAEAIRTGRAEVAIWNDPQAFLDALPEDKSLTAEEKIKYEKQAIDLRKKRSSDATLQLSIANSKSSIQLANAMIADTMTPQMIDDMVEQKVLAPKTAKVFFRALTAVEEPDDTAHADAYLDMLKTLGTDRVSALKIIEKAVTAHSKKIMNDDNLAYFLRVADKRITNMEKGGNWITRTWKGAMQNLQMISVMNASLMQSFFDKISTGTEIDQAVKEVKDEVAVSLDPSLQTSKEPLVDLYKNRALELLKNAGATDLSDKAISEVAEQIKYADDNGLQINLVK